MEHFSGRPVAPRARLGGEPAVARVAPLLAAAPPFRPRLSIVRAESFAKTPA